MPASAAFSAQGTTLKLDISTVFTEIPEVLTIGGPDGETEEIEVTSLNSPNSRREYILGLIDEGNLNFEVNFLPANSVQQALETARTDRLSRNWKIVFADAGNAEVAFTALVKSGPWSIGIGEQVKRSWNLRVTGAITITP